MTTYELLCFNQSSIYISPHLWCWAQATKDLGIRFSVAEHIYTLMSYSRVRANKTHNLQSHNW